MKEITGNFMRRLAWAGVLLTCAAAPALASNVDLFHRVHTTVPIRDLAQSPAGYVAAGANGIWVTRNLTDWHRLNVPAGMGLPLNSVIWTGSEFIIGGAGGMISSSDGVHWTLDYSDPARTPNINSVVYAGGVYLAAGSDDNGVLVLRSSDGHTWTAEDTGLTNSGGNVYSAEGAVYGDGLYVVQGQRSGTTLSPADFVVTSPDGITWTQATLPRGGNNRFLGAGAFDGAYGNGTFVIGGISGVYTSPDGVTWTAVPFPFGTLWLMVRSTFVNGQFVGVGRNSGANPKQVAIFTSPDGATWSETDLSTRRESSLYELGAILPHGAGYLAAGYLGAWTSPDAASWTRVYDGPQSNGYQCLVYGAGNYLMLPALSLGIDSLVLRSHGGATWPDTLTDVGARIGGGTTPGCAVFGDGKFVAGGFGFIGEDIFYSNDGASWNGSGLPTNFGAGPVAWNGSQFVAFGDYNDGKDLLPLVFSSPDGTTWNEVSFSGLPLGNSLIYYNLAAANGNFFAWYSLPPLFVSADGTTWSAASLPGAFTTLAGIAYGRGRYVAVGGDADHNLVVATSTDGMTWTQESVGVPGGLTSRYTFRPIFAGGEFLIPSNDRTAQSSAYLISHDGLTWTKTLQPQNWYLQQIAWDGTKFVASSAYDIFNAPGVALNLDGRVKAIVGGGVHLKYTFRLGNDSTDGTTANDAVFSDPLPAHVAFESATSTRGNCAFAGGKVICNLGDLAPGTTAGVSVQVRVTANVCSISNTAEGYAEEPVRDDANPSATVTITRPHC